MVRTTVFLILFAAIDAGTAVVVADEPSGQPPGFLKQEQLTELGFHPLLAPDDPTLEKWNATETHSSHWIVRDGVIRYDGDCGKLTGDERHLWSKQSFRDLQCYVEWRFPSEPTPQPQPIVLWNGDFLRDEHGKRITRLGLDAGDSGILFRGTMACQANIWCQELGSGEVNAYRTNNKLTTRLRQSCIPFARADNPIGQWNAFLITLQNDRLSVQLNGQPVVKTRRLPNLPESGPIGFQHHGDAVEFRNIWVKELANDE
tara:strand:- start:90731 stop:91507 length:777 start_codon:yes stop_codon:yes gene_type:complete